MEPITTAAIAVALLAAQKGAEKLGDEAGRATWSGLGRLVSTLRSRLQGDKEAESALATVESRPNDERALAVLGLALQRQMEQDEMFAKQLERLVVDAETRGEVTDKVSIKADTIKAIFQDKVEVQGDFNIS